MNETEAVLHRQLLDAEDENERLREEFTVLVDACGHCLAANRPPNQTMIDAARAALSRENHSS